MIAILFIYLFQTVTCHTEFYEGYWNRSIPKFQLPVYFRLKIKFIPSNSSISTVKTIFSYINTPSTLIPNEPFSATGIYVNTSNTLFILFTHEPIVQIQRDSKSHMYDEIGKYIASQPRINHSELHIHIQSMIKNLTTPKEMVTYIFNRTCNGSTCNLTGSQYLRNKFLYNSLKTYDYIELDKKWRIFVSFFAIAVTFLCFIWLKFPKSQPSVICPATIHLICSGDYAIAIVFFGLKDHFDLIDKSVFSIVFGFSFLSILILGSSFVNKVEMAVMPSISGEWITAISGMRHFYMFLLLTIFYEDPLFAFILRFSYLIPQIIFSALYNKAKTINIFFITSMALAQLAEMYLLIQYNPDKNYYFKNSEDLLKITSGWIGAQIFVVILQHFFGGAFFIPKTQRAEHFSYLTEKPPPDAECTICLQNVEEGEPYYSTPCHHYFHQECLSRWMEEQSICPVCRTPLPPIEDPSPPSPLEV
ncbi:hypothetical protein TRFO_24130 [Tritrichomonas foetus]|uniref:RING-type E3 ubiquitin transferase n=1 Tax=Tritrichomonas foetus TaxID=1144522 RepID=A0A1J4K9L2_9EUKA|nr:hypothetical protein TRFO_24130 [Tritrichomonas foetus]|eukprot:OHT07634.1 hypothetical protein TRFO_24130 [Tritrichomonas foetus]